jgi:hypothetical protein
MLCAGPGLQHPEVTAPSSLVTLFYVACVVVHVCAHVFVLCGSSSNEVHTYLEK